MNTRSTPVPSVLRTAVAVLALLPFAAAQWTMGPSPNVIPPGAVVRHGADIYAVGGGSAVSDTLQVLYSGNTSWTSLASLPLPQPICSAAVVGNKIYTFGGYGPLDTCQIYDIALDTWQSGPPVPVALYWATPEAVGTDVYLIGGYSPGLGGARDSLFILDTITNTWRQGPNLPGVMQIPCSAVHGHFIYAFVNGRNYEYDLVSGMWGTFPPPPSGHGGAGADAVTVGNLVYLIGGSSGSIYVAYPTVEILDPQTGVWTNGPSLPIGRAGLGAVYLTNEGNIYVVGGRDGSNNQVTTVEVLAAVPSGLQPYGAGTPGSSSQVPLLAAAGVANRGSTITLGVSNGLGGTWGGLLIGGPGSNTSVPVLGGAMLVNAELVQPIVLGGQFGLPGAGSTSIPMPVPNNSNLVGFNVNWQAVLVDAGAPAGVAASNGLAIWVR